MCKCTPEKKTSFCGKPGCEWVDSTNSLTKGQKISPPLTADGVEFSWGMTLYYPKREYRDMHANWIYKFSEKERDGQTRYLYIIRPDDDILLKLQKDGESHFEYKGGSSINDVLSTVLSIHTGGQRYNGGCPVSAWYADKDKALHLVIKEIENEISRLQNHLSVAYGNTGEGQPTDELSQSR